MATCCTGDQRPETTRSTRPRRSTRSGGNSPPMRLESHPGACRNVAEPQPIPGQWTVGLDSSGVAESVGHHEAVAHSQGAISSTRWVVHDFSWGPAWQGLCDVSQSGVVSRPLGPVHPWWKPYSEIVDPPHNGTLSTAQAGGRPGLWVGGPGSASALSWGSIALLFAVLTSCGAGLLRAGASMAADQGEQQ
jgi:hypothetical protein